MTNVVKCFVIGASAFLITGCASVVTQLPDISAPSLRAEKDAQEKLAFEVYDDMAKRLLAVGYPILVNNADLCPKVKSSLGVFTLSLSDFSKRLKAGAARELGAGLDPHIFHVAPNSPASDMKLQRGDIIQNEAGIALEARSIRKALEAKDALFIERNGDVMSLSIKGDRACDYNLVLKQSAAVNAYVDGRNININTGMMEFVESDEELAVVIGHELAHNTLGHVRKVLGNLILSGFATRYTRPFESEADYVGMYYAKRAGYDIEGVENLWRRLAQRSPKNVGRAKTHPSFPTRYLRLAATRDEINAKIEAGEPLIPNFIKGKDSVLTEAPSKK